MAVICQYGGQRKPELDRYQPFDVAAWIDFLGVSHLPNAGILGQIASSAIGIPVGAIDLDGFCETEPTGPEASAADYVALFAMTGVAWASGALDRIRNDYMRWQFAQWCICKPPEAPHPQYLVVDLGHFNGGPAGTSVVQAAVQWLDQLGAPQSTDYGEFTVEKDLSAFPVAAWVSPAIQGSVTHVTFRVISSTLGDFDTQFFLQDCPPLIGTNNECVSPISQQWAITTPQAGGPPYDGDVVPPGGTGTTYPEPAGPAEPPNAAAVPSCAPVTSFEDVGAELCQVNTKLDWLTQAIKWLSQVTVPPTYNPDPEPTSPTSGGALDKPADASGAVIQLTTIPSHLARYGQPLFFPDAGHYALLTPEGALPSQLVKHNPMVVFPIPAAVVQIVLDLAEGVEAQVQWLRQPK